MIKEQIFLRGICDEAKKHFPSGGLSTGIYSAARLMMEDGAALLVIAVNKRGSFLSEMLLSSDHRDNENRLRDVIVDFTRRTDTSHVILAIRKTDEDDLERFRYRAAFAVVIKEMLRKSDVILEGFYLTENKSFDFQDLSPLYRD